MSAGVCAQCPEKTPASPWPPVSTYFPLQWTRLEIALWGKKTVRGKYVYLYGYAVCDIMVYLWVYLDRVQKLDSAAVVNSWKQSCLTL